jgi:hypothetical protein
MARSKLTDTSNDLITDGGAVLWSFVLGEQLEYPVTLDFIENAGLGYVYEAVVIEANNIENQTDRPTAIKPSGVQNTLVVRVPVFRGNWDAPQAYNYDEVVLYSGTYYRKLREATEAVINSTPPNISIHWEETTPNRVYIQFPGTLGLNYSQAPIVNVPTYGFFELRVTEPVGYSFRRTWKPIRGMLQLMFSPTHVVPDA